MHQPERERAAFLLAECPHDEELRGEVAALLAADREAGGFLENRRVVHLTTGARLGPYEIVSFVGAGGMGEVYRARDPRLGRTVAIKVLTEASPLDAARLERFEREARAAAALSHSNVLAVFDIGTHEGAPYLVSELLEGESLRGVLARGTLGTARAVEIAIQVARGLAAAHDKGIVHRDLKPENLFVTRDGTVKILDFGLAKLVHQPAEDRGSSLTRTGMVMGTAGYMAPEQVRGQPADERADVFALGAVLYEMLGGRRAFAGENQAVIFSAVLHEEPPPLLSLRTELPTGLARIAERCLRKDPGERFQSARDVSFALEALGSDGGAPTEGIGLVRRVFALSGDRQRRSKSTWLLGGLVVAGVLGAVVAGVLGSVLVRSDADPATDPPRYRQLTFRRGTLLSARLAPDGHTLVYGAAWDGAATRVFTGRVESPESRVLEVPPGDVLAVSAGGELALAIGRRAGALSGSGGTLARVPLAGGAPRELLNEVHAADWAPDGALAVVRDVAGRSRLELLGGNALFETAGWISDPRFSPDGERIAFLHHPMASNDGGALKVVDRAGAVATLSDDWTSAHGLAWAPSGDEVWFTASRSGGVRALWAVKLDGHERLVERAPGTLTLHDIAADGRVLVAVESLRLGILCRGPGQEEERDLSWFDWSLVRDLSEDGGTLLFDESGEGAGPSAAVYLRSSDGSPAIRLDDGAAMALSPDGRWVISIPLEGAPRLVLLPTGAGSPRELVHPGVEAYHWADWFPDGRSIFFAANAQGEGVRGFVRALDAEAARPITKPGISVFWKPIAPGGRRLVLSGPDGLAIYSVDGGAPTPLPELLPGERPVRWSSNGEALFLVRGDAPLLVDRYELGTGRREPWRVIAPADSVGLVEVPRLVMTGDGNWHAYSHTRLLSVLYLVNGLR